MESVVMENGPTDVDESQDVKGLQSAEIFQKFMYELFEKNGVLNDLRSCLRGHIISVLRSVQTGAPPSCQKHFTQRLELTFQALNILIAEYLLRLEFNYSLSVFISEIPLVNMMFAFAKTLMKNVDNDDSRPRFKDSDVWCILNYLGVKCDSEHASNILEMYRMEEGAPLLLCILKCMRLFNEHIFMEQLNSSRESILKSSGSNDEKSMSPMRIPTCQEKCQHYAYCKTCQSKITKVKEKYRKKKKEIAKNLKESSLNSLGVEPLLKNITLMERSLIDEMFEELKTVYEAEMELIRREEDERVKRSLETHSTQLQNRRDEMEESFKAREIELENNVHQKKRFLWGLARALREQHQHMARAMHDVRVETSRLSAKENSLKSQLAQAEEVLRARGADMRQQISAELATLETHLATMKCERDNIHREREQLQLYKEHAAKNIDSTENEHFKTQYNVLKDEMSKLMRYLETVKLEPKCVKERSSLTDLHDVTSKVDVVLNNEQDMERKGDEDRAKSQQLVNDLKKQKNVNFIQSTQDEDYYEKSRSCSRSSVSSEAADALFETKCDSTQRLRDDNEQLRSFVRQQRVHIDSMSSQVARLQAELSLLRMQIVPTAPPPAPHPASITLRPRTAPSPAVYAVNTNGRMNACASVNHFSSGWRKGAGEELGFFNTAQPRIVVPGDAIPFVGVINRHTDNRRYLLNQWRALRRRISPQRGASRRASPQKDASRHPSPQKGTNGRGSPQRGTNGRGSPQRGTGGHVFKVRARLPKHRHMLEKPETAGPSTFLHLDEVDIDSADVYQPNVIESEENLPAEYQPAEYHRALATPSTDERAREKSPKSILREAKEKLRNKDTVRTNTPIDCEKSPNCVLREAKLRLRKLEIEAEAVEKSYLDFRRKQHAVRDTKPSTSRYKLDETKTKESSYQSPLPTYDRYFKEYQSKLSTGECFKNKNTAAVIANPIPDAFATQESKNNATARINPIPNMYSTQAKKTVNYLETTLTEFRKLYHTGYYSNQRLDTPSHPKSPEPKSVSGSHKTNSSKETSKEIIRQTKHGIVNDLEIMKNNIGKIYNMTEQAKTNEVNKKDPECNEIEPDSRNAQNIIENFAAKIDSKHEVDDRNLLRVEVESVSEINDVKMMKSQTQEMSLIVESSVDKDNDGIKLKSELGRDITSTKMTIIISPKTITNGQDACSDRDESLSDRYEIKTSYELSSKSLVSSKKESTKNPGKEIPVSGNIRCGKSDEMTTDDVIVAIYNSNDDVISNVQMQVDLAKDVLDYTISELEQSEDSMFELENQTRASIPKTSDEDNFWDF